MEGKVKTGTVEGNWILVAAIDIGTTFSGYAFSFRSDFRTNPLKIHPNDWSLEGVHNPSLKAPSVVLLNPDCSFNSFGYEAQYNYQELEEPAEAVKYFYVENFKMQLHDKVISLDMVIEDNTGKNVLAIRVFKEAIQFLKDHLLRSLNQHNGSIGYSVDDVLFVITVPAIWTDSAKQFMRTAAEMAGIRSHQMILAYEPEAAALHCSLLPEDQGIAKYFQLDRRIMIVDLGGGTVDITIVRIIRKTENLTYLEHVFKVSGGAFGGNEINKNFKNFLRKNIFGDDVMDRFLEEYPSLYLELMKDFEIQKKTLTGRREIGIKIYGELTGLFKQMKSEDLKKKLEMQFMGKIKLKFDKIMFESNFFYETFFNKCLANMIGVINRIFSEKGCAFPSTMVLVGGFAEAPVVRKCIKEAFPVIKDIVYPLESSLSVLKGSVIFGHNPSVVTGRVCRETIGIALHRPYNPEEHLKDKTFKLGGRIRVDDCFESVFQVNEIIKIGEKRTIQVHDLHENNDYRRKQPKIIEIYSSQQKDPKYITDPGCKLKGRIKVNPPRSEWLEVVEGLIEIEAGGTEIIVRYRDRNTGETTEGRIDFM